MHTTVDGGADVLLGPQTRLDVIAGGNHGPGSMPPALSGNTRYLNNGNDCRGVMRGLLVAMQRWLADGTAPLESVYPRVDRKELAPTQIRDVFRLDFGPEFRTRGMVAYERPRMGPVFGVLVPQVDGEGNDLGGLKTPQVAVPLAAHTGWNLRNPKIGSPEELFSMVGSYFPFAQETVARGLMEGRYLLPGDLASLDSR